MDTMLQEKLDNFRTIMKNTGGCAVAFSGGVDSTLVLTVAHEVLGDKSLAVIATSSTYPERECKKALDWVKENAIPHVVIHSEELDIPDFSKNPTNRCYYCKKELFEKVAEEAQKHGIKYVADGSNADDRGDYRPGLNAARELGVISPLMEAGLTKEDIRTISREIYQLPTADKPAAACLASRFPYGDEITISKLGQIERIENFLEKEGLRVFRARHHGTILRLELGPEEMIRIFKDDLRDRVVMYVKDQGFSYVTLDLEGYRTGSMNEPLKPKDKVKIKT